MAKNAVLAGIAGLTKGLQQGLMAGMQLRQRDEELALRKEEFKATQDFRQKQLDAQSDLTALKRDQVSATISLTRSKTRGREALTSFVSGGKTSVANEINQLTDNIRQEDKLFLEVNEKLVKVTKEISGLESELRGFKGDNFKDERSAIAREIGSLKSEKSGLEITRQKIRKRQSDSEIQIENLRKSNPPRSKRVSLSKRGAKVKTIINEKMEILGSNTVMDPSLVVGEIISEMNGLSSSEQEVLKKEMVEKLRSAMKKRSGNFDGLP